MGINFSDGANLRVETLVCVIYGAPNVGKSTLALTANKPAMLDFDHGSYRASHRTGKAIATINDWEEAIIDANDLKKYDTVVIDTVGRCLDYLSADIIRNNAKHGNNGALTLQGYGVLKARFKAFLDQLRGFGCDVVLVAHMDEQSRGDDIVERIVAVGSSRNEIYQSADLMGRIFIDRKRRVLSFNPSVTSFGKNVGLDDFPLDVSNPNMLADILAAAKDKINESAKKDEAKRKQEREALKGLEKRMDGLGDTAEEWNDLVNDMKDSSATTAMRKRVVKEGIERGLKWDAKSAQFESNGEEASEDEPSF